MSQRLLGKTAIITGASRGIGATAARLFHEHGANVAIFDIKDELGSQLVESLQVAGSPTVRYYHCDVTSLEDVRTAVEKAYDELGAINVLFNNAGTSIVGKVDVLEEEKWDLQFAVNVKSMFLCSKFVIPIMRENGGGSIIHQASESGLIGFEMHPAYCSSKGAVINLTRSMALGHAKEKIRVNCICPGTIPTPLIEEFLEQAGDRSILDVVEEEHPLGLGTELDIAYAALYLASDESKYMTGSPLIVDGGYTAK